MLKTIIGSLILIGSIQAHAERLPAVMFGLTPETGYLEAVTRDEVCDPQTDVLLSNRSTVEKDFITKCDGSRIGWVTRIVKPEELTDITPSNLYADLEITTGEYEFRFINHINIYTCGSSRAEELAGHPEVAPNRKARKMYQKLKRLAAEGRSVRIQLFYNEFVFSGKCIGGVEVLADDKN